MKARRSELPDAAQQELHGWEGEAPVGCTPGSPCVPKKHITSTQRFQHAAYGVRKVCQLRQAGCCWDQVSKTSAKGHTQQQQCAVIHLCHPCSVSRPTDGHCSPSLTKELLTRMPLQQTLHETQHHKPASCAATTQLTG